MKKLYIILMLFLTLLSGTYAEETSTTYIQIGSEIHNAEARTNYETAGNSIFVDGHIHENGYIPTLNTETYNVGGTGTVYIRQFGEILVQGDWNQPSTFAPIGVSFPIDEWTDILKAGNSFEIEYEVLTGTMAYKLSNAQSTGSLFTIYSGSRPSNAAANSYIAFYSLDEFTTKYPATYNNVTNIDLTTTYYQDANLFEYLFTGNESVYPTRNDGTLSGYTFNDGTLTNGVLQHSEIDGSLVNGVVWNETRGVTFDGSNDYIDLGNLYSSWDETKEFTWSGWVYNTDSSEYDGIFQLGVGTDYIGLQNKLGIFSVGVYDGSSYIYKKSGSAVLNEWIYITVTYTGSELKFYINNVEQTGTVSPLLASNDGFFLGQRTDLFSGSYFNGSIDDIIILNKALNSTQVLELYNTGKTNYEDMEHLEGYEFNFDEGVGTESVGRTINGKFGKSLEFDGVDDEIQFNTNQISIIGSNYITISTWVKGDVPCTDNYCTILQSNTGSNSFFGLQDNLNNKLQFRFHNVSGNYAGTLNTGLTFLDGTWKYLTFTYDGINGDYKVYIDGVIQHQIIGSSVKGVLADFVIDNLGSAYQTASNNWFLGSLDELRVWDTALTVGEILLEMDSSNPVKSDGLVASYSFEEHAGVTTYDTNHIVEGAESGEKGMAFDGVDDYTSNSGSSLLATQGTICLEHNSNVNTASFDKVFGHYNSGSRIYLQASTTGNRFQWVLGAGETGTYTTTDSLNEWNSRCLIYNSGNAEIFDNGVSDGNFTYTGLSSISTFELGALYVASAGNFYEGTIDNVRIYNTSLSATDVSNLYNGTYTDTTNLVAHYTFEEMQNSLIHDRNNQLCVNCQVTLESKVLAEGTYTQWYLDQLTNNTNSAFFIIDLTNPSLTDSLSVEYNNGYTINLTNYITYSDALSGVSSCLINFSTGQTTNCNNESFTLSYNGNITYDIVLTDNALNTNTSSGTLFLNPNIYLYFDNSATTNSISDFEVIVNSVTYNTSTDLLTLKTYDIGLSNQSFEFTKFGYLNTTFYINLNTTTDINLTTQIQPVTMVIKMYDSDTLAQISFDVTIFNSTNSVSFTSQTNFSKEYSELPVGDIEVRVEKTNYSTATFYADLQPFTAITITGYLFATASSEVHTFTIEDSATQDPLENVLVEVQQLINGTYTTLSQKVTAVNGVAYFYLDETIEYKVIFTKDSYVSSTATTIPTIRTYTVRLEESSTVFDYIDDLSYSITPSGAMLNDNTTYMFTGFISDSSFTSTSFEVKYGNGTILFSDSSTNPSGATFNYSYLIPKNVNQTEMIATLTYIQDGDINTIIKNYQIISFNNNSFLSTFENYGESTDEEDVILRWFIMMGIIMAVIITGSFMGTQSINLMVIPVVLGFALISWMSWTFALVTVFISLVMFVGGRK